MRWRWALVAFGIVFSVVAWIQQSRSVRDADEQTKAAIKSTAEAVSTKVAAETAKSVTGVLSEQYGETINKLNSEINQLKEDARKANELSNSQLALNYTPSLDVTYENGRTVIFNKGKTNVALWGSGYEGRRLIESSPAMISPQGSYYLLSESLRADVSRELGVNGEQRVPFDLYIQTENRKKFIVSFTLWEIEKNGQLTIHTQNHGAREVDWSKQP